MEYSGLQHGDSVFNSTLRSTFSLNYPSQRDQIWRNFATFAKKSSLCQISDSLFLIWQNVEPTLANLVRYCANFHCY